MAFNYDMICFGNFKRKEERNMELPFIMDSLFDLLNESENLNVTELEECEKDGLFRLTTADGTKLIITCSIAENRL